MRLPWSVSEYQPLHPTDMSGAPPSAEERIRVAAVVATANRDANMKGRTPPFSTETIRILLTMPDIEWRENAGKMRLALAGLGYDTESGEKRFKQVKALTKS